MPSKLGYRKRESLTGFSFALPAILGMLVFFLIPFGISFYTSLTGGVGSGRFLGLENYAKILKNESFQIAAGNTMKFIGIGVPLIMIISLLIALLLHRKLKGYNLFRTLFVLPLVLPVASVNLWMQLLFKNGGLMNGLLTSMGLPITDWLNSSGSFWVLIFLYVWKYCGYNIILFLAALNAIPREYYEVASLERAGPVTKLFRITLPLITPYLFFIFVISIINSFKAFREIILLVGRHPHEDIYMIQHFMFNNFENINYERLAVAAMLVFSVIIVLVFAAYMLRNKAGDIEL